MKACSSKKKNKKTFEARQTHTYLHIMAENEIQPKSEDILNDEDEYSNISFRLMDVNDIDDFMVWATDDKVSQYCTWSTYTSKEQAMDFFTNIVLLAPHPWLRAICLKNRAIGSISVTPFEGNDACRGELGYVLASKYWGKGIVTRAVKKVASVIFAEWPHLERLEALVDVENAGSQRVLQKAGFQREGVLRKYVIQKGRTRDMVIFSLLSSEIAQS
nr:PREDICTED: LOW QUALITY PROTEIN: uncharacterized N-acetyltransferase p20-like [Daucus carota subsp. sativus]